MYELHQACKKGDIHKITELLLTNDINEQDATFKTPLIYALENNQLKTLFLLLKNNNLNLSHSMQLNLYQYFIKTDKTFNSAKLIHDCLYYLGDQIIKRDPDNLNFAVDCFKQALLASTSILNLTDHYRWDFLETIRILTIQLIDLDKREEAAKYFDQGLKLLGDIKNDHESLNTILLFLNKNAENLEALGDHLLPNAIQMRVQILSLLKSNSLDENQILKQLDLLACLYKKTKNHQEAINCYLEGIELINEYEFTDEHYMALAYSYKNIANVYAGRIGYRKESKLNFQLSIEALTQINDWGQIMVEQEMSANDLYDFIAAIYNDWKKIYVYNEMGYTFTTIAAECIDSSISDPISNLTRIHGLITDESQWQNNLSFYKPLHQLLSLIMSLISLDEFNPTISNYLKDFNNYTDFKRCMDELSESKVMSLQNMLTTSAHPIVELAKRQTKLEADQNRLFAKKDKKRKAEDEPEEKQKNKRHKKDD